MAAHCENCGREAFPNLREAKLSEFVARHSGEFAATFDPENICPETGSAPCERAAKVAALARATQAEQERDESRRAHGLTNNSMVAHLKAAREQARGLAGRTGAAGARDRQAAREG